MNANEHLLPLHDAAQRGDLPKLKALVEQLKEIDPGNPNGFTPLMRAAEAGHSETVKWLLGQGACVRRRANDGETPLHMALNGVSWCGRGNPEVVVMLLDAGSDISAQDTQGWTPLYAAVASGFEDAVNVLLVRGAPVNEKTSFDDTPLCRAVRGGNLQITKTLLQRGADPSLPGHEGRTMRDEIQRAMASKWEWGGSDNPAMRAGFQSLVSTSPAVHSGSDTHQQPKSELTPNPEQPRSHRRWWKFWTAE